MLTADLNQREPLVTLKGSRSPGAANAAAGDFFAEGALGGDFSIQSRKDVEGSLRCPKKQGRGPNLPSLTALPLPDEWLNSMENRASLAPLGDKTNVTNGGSDARQRKRQRDNA